MRPIALTVYCCVSSLVCLRMSVFVRALHAYDNIIHYLRNRPFSFSEPHAHSSIVRMIKIVRNCDIHVMADVCFVARNVQFI